MTKLRGWKEIARHLRADERTVRRWEGRGLPVHRVPGEGRSSVFAEAAELDQWLGRAGEPGEPNEPLAPGSGAGAAMRPRRGLLALLGVAIVAAALIGVAWWRGPGLLGSGPLAPRRPADPRATALTQEAGLQNGRATAEGYRRAIDLSQAAIARDPRAADAYAELSLAYIHLPEVDATVDARVAYERAQRAAQRALDLDPRSWRAHSTMGFIEYGYHWNFVAGIRHFREVIRLNPARGPGYDQLGLALLNMGDTKGALAELGLAARMESANAMYRAHYAKAQYVAGDRQAAVDAWRQILADNPNLVPVREMLLDDMLARRDWRAASVEVAETARLVHVPADDPATKSIERALSAGEPKAIFGTLLRIAQAQLAAGKGGNLEIARIDAQAGDRDGAFAALKKALEAREPGAIAMRTDPLLGLIRDDPRFEQLATTYGITPSALRDAS